MSLPLPREWKRIDYFSLTEYLHATVLLIIGDILVGVSGIRRRHCDRFFLIIVAVLLFLGGLNRGGNCIDRGILYLVVRLKPYRHIR